MLYIKNIVYSEDVSYSETKILGNQIITVDDVCVLGMALTDFFEIIRNCGCITEMTLIAGISVSKLPDDNDNPESIQIFLILRCTLISPVQCRWP